MFSSSLPFFLLLFFLHPPSFRLCVSLFDGLVFALCFPLSLHSAVQRRHGPEAGHQKWERHAGGVWAQGEITLQRCIFLFCWQTFRASGMLYPVPGVSFVVMVVSHHHIHLPFHLSILDTGFLWNRNLSLKLRTMSFHINAFLWLNNNSYGSMILGKGHKKMVSLWSGLQIYIFLDY